MPITSTCRPEVGASNAADYIEAMVDIVNLRRARKAKSRAATEEKAKANRIAHGLSKADRRLAKAESDAVDKKLDGHKRDDS